MKRRGNATPRQSFLIRETIRKTSARLPTLPRRGSKERAFTSGRTRNEICVAESHKTRHAHGYIRGEARPGPPLAWIIKVLNLVSHCRLIITGERGAHAGVPLLLLPFRARIQSPDPRRMENRRCEVEPLHGASIRPLKDGGVVGRGGEATLQSCFSTLRFGGFKRAIAINRGSPRPAGYN